MTKACNLLQHTVLVILQDLRPAEQYAADLKLLIPLCC